MRYASQLCIAWCFLPLCFCACSSSSSSTADSSAHRVDAGQPDASALPCESSSAVELEGRWALAAKFSLRLRSQAGGMMTMCPTQQRSEAMMSFLLDISHDSAGSRGVAIRARACSLELPVLTAMAGSCDSSSGALLSVQIPIPELLTSVLPSTQEANVSGILDDTLADPAFRSDSMIFTFGGRSSSSQLPRWQVDRANCGPFDFDLGHQKYCESACVDDCSAAYDDDNDGYAGVSVDVCGYSEDDLSSKVACRSDAPNEAGSTLQGRMSMVFRAALSLVGKARSSCEVLGSFDAATTYSVLGADAYLINTMIPVASVINSLPFFDADSDSNRFRMIRVDGLHGAPDYHLDGQSPASACSVIRLHKNDLL